MKLFAGKSKQVVSLGILVVLGIFVLHGFAFAADAPASSTDGSSSMLGGTVKGAILWLLGAVLYLVGKLFDVAVYLLNLLISKDAYQSVFFSPQVKNAINLGWAMVRDFLNMFFILALILVAISKILRIKKYGDEKIFFNVIAGALLINFSKAITLVVIDFSQLAMGFFSDALSGSNFMMSFLKNSGMGKALELKFSALGDADTQAFVGAVFAIIFVFIMAMMILALALALVFRYVAFWVLLVLSPLAFFGLFFPGANGMWSKWQKKLVGWAFFGPTMLFFLVIASYFISALGEVKIPSPQSGGIDGVIIGILQYVLPYIVAIYLLWYGLDSSMSLANDAGSSAAKVMGWARDKFDKKFVPIGVGLGTLGAAPAAYGVYKGGALAGNALKDKYTGRTKAWLEGKKETSLGKKLLGDKKKEEERREEIKARASGKLQDFYRKKAFEQKKKWEEEGDSITNTDLFKELRTGDSIKSKAAAIKLAERGKFSKTEDYAIAYSKMGDDQKLLKTLREKAEKKNLYSVLDHDISLLEEKRRVKGLGPLANRDNVFKNYVANKTKDMSFKQMAEQDDKWNTSNEFKDAVMAEIAAGTRKRDKLRDYVEKNLGSKKAAQWEANGFL